MRRFISLVALFAAASACTPSVPPLPQEPEIILQNPANFGTRDRNFSLTESADGSVRAYSAMRGDDTDILIQRRTDTGWTAPAPLNFPRRETNMSPHFSPYDGRFYFASDAQHPNRIGRTDLNLWSGILEADNSLSDARPLGDEINTGASEDSIAFDADGRFVFTSDHTRGSGGGFDLYAGQVSRDGSPWALKEIKGNTRMADSVVTMTRDGNHIIYYAHMPDILGIVDLFRRDRTDAGWSDPVNLGPLINTPGLDYGAGFSADESLFYFSRDGQLMQVDAAKALTE